MRLEEFAFILQSGADGLVGLDIALSTIDHRYVAQTQGNDATSKNINNIGALVPVR